MEYSKENLTPIKIKFAIKNSPDEVDKALGNAVEDLKKQVQLPGFRKGKAPNTLIIKKFAEEIKKEAQEKLLEQTLLEILEKEAPKPLGNYSITQPANFEKREPIEWSVEYEIMPEFDIPEYKGLKVEEKETVVTEEDVERALNGLKLMSLRKRPVQGDSPAVDGQIAVIDVDIMEDGQPVPEFALKRYELEVGKNTLISDIDAIVRGLPVGNVTEQEIAFPDDFPNPKLAGATKLVRVKVLSVNEIDSSAWDKRWQGEEGEKGLAELKELIRTAQSAEQKEFNKGVAETALLDQLLKQTDFPIPEVFTRLEFERILSEYQNQLQSRGLSLAALGEKLEETIEKAKKNAKVAAARQTLLMAIAAKEGLEVGEDELYDAIEKYSQENNEDVGASLQSLQRSGMLAHLKNKLLADKAMTLLYESADITRLPPAEGGTGEK